MEHLREIDGEDKKDCDSCKIKLDEKLIDQEELKRRQEDQSVRIVEKSPGEFKTLNRIRG